MRFHEERRFKWGHVSFYTNLKHAYSDTTFWDGTCVPAIPHDTEEYRNRSVELGYGEDTAAMSREHEYLHNRLAVALGFTVSNVLWDIAHHTKLTETDKKRHYEEERMVLEFQRYMNNPSLFGVEGQFMQKLRRNIIDEIR